MAGQPEDASSLGTRRSVILPDTSAWVEFLRQSGHPVHLELRRLIDEGEDVAITEQVIFELLAGAGAGPDLLRLRERLFALPLIPYAGLDDAELAAWIYRACREAGHSLRSLNDCLVAAPAIRTDSAVLHNDSDFDVMARHAGLRIHEAPKRPRRPRRKTT